MLRALRPPIVHRNHTLTNLLFLLYFLNKRLTIGGLFPWYHLSMGEIMLSLPAILSFMQCRAPSGRCHRADGQWIPFGGYNE